MARIIGWALVIGIVFMGSMYGISTFLSSDDLALCGDHPSSEENCQKADAVVAISGGNTVARANSAIDLYEKAWANKIIFSGATADPNTKSNAETMKELALSQGVPEKDILLDETSSTTIENARNVAEIIKKNDWNNIILTTSSYHLRRSKVVFEATGNNIRTSINEEGPWGKLWWTTPHGWSLALHELGGLLVFYLNGANI